MRQGVVLPETPRDRRERAALEEDIRSMPIASAPVALRLRNFQPAADAYLAASRGPAPYMVRLHEIETRTAEHEDACRAAWRELALDRVGDDESFERRWVDRAASFVFDDVNELADRHNLWYPVEAGLPMDPSTGDFVLVNGRSYRLEHLDAEWVLDRFPPDLGEALRPGR
jgi:hypothetical protein